MTARVTTRRLMLNTVTVLFVIVMFLPLLVTVFSGVDTAFIGE
jgi:hypothetical protein